jgi:hypothetical protein
MNFQIRCFYYGDIPDTNAGGSNYESKADTAAWPLWEVFIRASKALIINM